MQTPFFGSFYCIEKADAVRLSHQDVINHKSTTKMLARIQIIDDGRSTLL
jgi:hypothetical protein